MNLLLSTEALCSPKQCRSVVTVGTWPYRQRVLTRHIEACTCGERRRLGAPVDGYSFRRILICHSERVPERATFVILPAAPKRRLDDGDRCPSCRRARRGHRFRVWASTATGFAVPSLVTPPCYNGSSGWNTALKAAREVSGGVSVV